MATRKNNKKEAVHPMDSEAAISDILEIMKENGITENDFISELGWSKKKVYDFLYGVKDVYKSDLDVIAKYLAYTVDYSCTDGGWQK